MVHLGLLLLLVLCLQLPQLYARHTMKKNSQERGDLPGTARQLLVHLKKKFNLTALKISSTPLMDHFNPETNTVCLTPDKLDSKSLTAVAVAAHEFSHALQFAEGSYFLRLRTSLAKLADQIRRLFNFALLIGLFFAFAQPSILVLFITLWILALAVGVLVHLITLPVELDASFTRALPILEEYLSQSDLAVVRDILRACAYTYLAASLASFFAIFYILRRPRPL